MRVVWKKGFDQSKVTDNNYISLAQFEYAVFFEENYEEEIASGVYPGVIMTLLLRRKISYHLLQTYLPSGLFVIVAWLSLFLPPESIPGRVTMAMTTLLTLAAMFGAVRQSTPKVSYVSALDIWMCTCIIFVFFALLEYVVVLCLINHCQVGGGPTNSEERTDRTNSEPCSKPLKKSASSTSPMCRRHSCLANVQQGAAQQHHHHHPQVASVGTNATTDNNGMKMCCTSEVVGPSSASPCHIAHIPEPPSPRVNVKKRNIFFCCSRRAAKKRAAAAASSARVLHKHDQEMALQGRLVASSSTKSLSTCATCRAGIDTQPRAHSGRRNSVNQSGCVKGSRRPKRPFQQVEKTCSVIMALLFVLFNAFYWPWLLRDGDFDYAKFAASQQIQLKM